MENNLFNPNEAAAALTGNPKHPKGKSDPHPKHPNKQEPVQASIDVDSTGFPKPGSPYWKEHPLITEHSDGTVGPWGGDTTKRNPNLLPKQMLPPPPPKVQPSNNGGMHSYSFGP